MRVSWQWLGEWVDLTGLTPEKVAEALTSAGLEVEALETLGGQFSGVLVGFVHAVQPHPNADRLRLVTVDLGSAGESQVVCGAPNVREGLYVAYATIGARVLNRKDGGLFELTPAVIRGVESTGMICSLDELGLQEQYPASEEGIWPLNAWVQDNDRGQDLRTVLGLVPDVILETAPTANRGDLMSMQGVAREVAALFDRPLRESPAVLPTNLPETAYRVSLSDPSVCTFYAGAVLSNVAIADSPAWLKQRLAAAGVRSINTAVDITNYVMLATGQPLHAFDLQTLGTTGTVGVRRAKSDESLRTLDGVDRTLTDESVVVTFADHPIALAGVMGGESTEISEKTQGVFLEVAYFPPTSNRKSARSVGLRSEASARFERGIDPAACEAAFAQAVSLFQELTGATLQGVCQDDHRALPTVTLTLSHTRMTRMLGLDIPRERIPGMLTPLGFTVTPGPEADVFQVHIPSFRQHDVTRPIDVLEEVIRIYGYDRIPYTLPQETASPVVSLRSRMVSAVRHTMAGAGLQEVVTMSLIGPALLAQTGFEQDPKTTVSVTNSHSQDHVILRQRLLPTMLDVARNNQDHGNETLWCFELGRTYFLTAAADARNPGVEERLYLAGLLMGHPQQGIWHEKRQPDFYTIKGLLENLFQALNLKQTCRWTPLESTHPEAARFHPGQTAMLKLGKQPLGIVGHLHPLLQDTMKLKHTPFVFELDLERLYHALAQQDITPFMTAISAFPAVHRDVALVAPAEVTHQKVLSAITQVQDPLLQNVTLFDEYRGDWTDGRRSLAYRLTLQSPTQTLTDATIDATVDRIKQQLTQALAVTFR